LTRPGLSRAFNLFGNHNTVVAGNPAHPGQGGPFAIAGAIGGSNKTVQQAKTGFNVK